MKIKKVYVRYRTYLPLSLSREHQKWTLGGGTDSTLSAHLRVTPVLKMNDEPSLLSAVIAPLSTVIVVPLISTPYIPPPSHNKSFAVWVVNGVATPFTTASDTPYVVKRSVEPPDFPATRTRAERYIRNC